MDLYEFEGKAFLARLGVSCPPGIFARSVESAGRAALAIGFPCVVKSQLPAGRAREADVVVVHDRAGTEVEARRLLAPEIGGESPVGLLIESLRPRGREIYAAVTFDTFRACPVLLFCPRCSSDVDGPAARMLRIPVPVEDLPGTTPAWVAERLADGLSPAGMKDVGNALEGVARLLANLLSSFCEYDLRLIELDPLVATSAGLIAAEATVVVDDAALFRQSENLARVGRPDRPEFEKRAHEAGLEYVELGGEICFMADGAGLHLSLLDGAAAFGSTPANLLDTGHEADAEGFYAGVRILQDRSMRDPTVRSRLIVLSLGVAEAMKATAGIARAMDDIADDPVPTFAVLHGACADEGRDILQRHGVTVAPDIRTAVEWAAMAERMPAAGIRRGRSDGEP
jgi:succinyl-CoA synthetase beta subunit